MPIKILTVDDSLTIRLVIMQAFQSFDCVISEAINGEEGLAMARNERPDLIHLDLNMPTMDGIAMLKILRADPELKAIPVIMLTAESDRESVFLITRLGVSDYILKPFAESLLIERARRIVPLEKKQFANARA